MKKKYYLTLDTETATLPFANEIAKNAKQKQKIAIAKPLVYDIGWVITDRLGNRVKRKQSLLLAQRHSDTLTARLVMNAGMTLSLAPLYAVEQSS